MTTFSCRFSFGFLTAHQWREKYSDGCGRTFCSICCRTNRRRLLINEIICWFFRPMWTKRLNLIRKRTDVVIGTYIRKMKEGKKYDVQNWCLKKRIKMKSIGRNWYVKFKFLGRNRCVKFKFLSRNRYVISGRNLDSPKNYYYNMCNLFQHGSYLRGINFVSGLRICVSFL